MVAQCSLALVATAAAPPQRRCSGARQRHTVEIYAKKPGQKFSSVSALLYFSSRFSGCFTCMGSFNNYVDKRRWVGGQKLPIYVHVQAKKLHLEVGRYVGR